MKKITAGICLIFRGLFFEHNAEIGQKDYLWMDTMQFLRLLPLVSFSLSVPAAPRLPIPGDTPRIPV